MKYKLPSDNPKDWIDNDYSANEWRHIIYALIERDIGEIPDNTMTYLSDCIKKYGRSLNSELIKKLVEMTDLHTKLKEKIAVINRKITTIKKKGHKTRVYKK